MRKGNTLTSFAVGVLVLSTIVVVSGLVYRVSLLNDISWVENQIQYENPYNWNSRGDPVYDKLHIQEGFRIFKRKFIAYYPYHPWSSNEWCVDKGYIDLFGNIRKVVDTYVVKLPTS